MTTISSTRAAARSLGVSDTALRKAERAGRIVREQDGSWNIERVRVALAKRPKSSGDGPAPWARSVPQLLGLPEEALGQARDIAQQLEIARRALDTAARQIATLYPEILRLERACDAAVAAQEKAEE
ncbi:hypothetical protein J4558_15930 [Leptolyngbya sp. 15MV]|nr:hypothetical protein J4558_15930 [Leptolyngbya sp. 15MV]